MRLFVDMDGTLAKWNEVQYEEQLLEEGYYRNLKPNQKVVDEVNSIIDKGYDVYVLSCVLPESQYAQNEKIEWLKEYLPQLKAEFEDEKKNDYKDLSHIGLAYTETEDGKHTIEVFCNLEKFKIIQLLDGVQVAERAYNSLSKLIDNELYSLSFDELVYLYDEQGFIEKVNMVNSQTEETKEIDNEPEIEM